MHLGMYITNLRIQVAKVVEEFGVSNFILLAVLAIITIYPLLFVGSTTKDDMDIAINFGFSINLLEAAYTMAETQGRFTYLWAYPLLRIPYIVDSQSWYLITKYGALLLLLGSLYYAVSRSFRSNWLAQTSLVFFLAFVQNGWDHNALTSYPFAFNIYAALFLTSIGLFSVAIDEKNLALAALSGVLYFFSLTIELFVLFFPFYVALLFSRIARGETVLRWTLLGRKYLSAILLPLVVYLIVYVIWRSTHPSLYDGNSLNAFNFFIAVKVAVIYSLSALPVTSLAFLITPDVQLQYTNPIGFRGMLSELDAVHFIKPAVAGFLFAALMRSKVLFVPKARTLIFGAALVGLGIFIPNILLAFVQKHQDWVAAGSHSYLYTYYSFISVVVSAALVFAYIKTKSELWKPGIRWVIIALGVVAVVVITFSVEVRNQYIAFDQKLSHRKWQLMDVLIESPSFTGIPNGSTIVAPTLSAHYRGIAMTSADYWSKYVKYKTGKGVNFVDDACENGAPCFLLVFRQEQHSDNQFIVFSKIKDSGPPVSSEMTIYSMPNRADSVLMGSFVAGDRVPNLLINGEHVTNVGGGKFAYNLSSIQSRGLVLAASLKSSVEVFPDQITISHYSVVPRLLPLSIELGEGFYGMETGARQPPWAWSTSSSEILVTNHSQTATTATVKFEVSSLEKINLNVLGSSVRSFQVMPDNYHPIEFSINVPPGTTRVKMQSDRPAASPGRGDNRLLSFAVRRLRIDTKDEN